LRSDRWRYIRYRDKTEELYDLMNDPNEWINLADEGQYEPVLAGFRREVPPQALP
jgi:iduronate 2-sulfatase